MALFKSADGTKTFSTVKTPTYKYKKGNQFGNFYSTTPGSIPTETNIAAMARKSEAALQPFIDKFGLKLLNKMAQSKYGKNFKDLDKLNELKFFKTQLINYEDFILKNKRYPNKSEATRIGRIKSGKDLGLGVGGITGDIEKFVKETYQSGRGGSTYIAKELAKPPYNFNINSSSIRKYIMAEEEAGRIVRPKSFETQKANPDLPKDRYFKVRPVTERDKRGFTVGRSGTEVKAPSWAKFKVTYKSPRESSNTLIPEKYFGTQYYKTEQSAIKALNARKKLDLSRTDEAVRVVNKLIKKDPDLATDIKTLAQEVYGAAEGSTNLAREQDLERKMRSVATDVTRLQEQLAGRLQGFDTKNISRLVLPTGALAENILTDITVNTDIGRFGGTEIRNSRMRIISGILNERKGKFNSLRNAVTKFVASGNHLDEVAGIGATYDVAPGYSSFGQSIPAEINQAKRAAIDGDFARLLRQAVLNEKGPKSFQKVKYNTLGEAIGAYNKFSKEFAKENKIFAPTIEYNPGKKLDPSKFAKNYANLRPEAKANVLELAKKGIGIGVGEAQPFEQILINAAKTNKGGVCQIFRAEGGRIGFAAGSNCARQMEEAFNADPIRTTEQINKLKTVPENIKSAGTGFLNFAKKGGKFGALAAVGAAGAGAVKTFMNDDPTTYLSNENQQKNMLIDMVTGQLDDTPQEKPEILDYQLPVLGAGAVAGTALTAPSSLKAFRGKALGSKKSGITMSVLKGLGRGLGALGTPLGMLATEPLYLTEQVQQGDSLAEIATNPLNYLGPAFLPYTDNLVRTGLNPTIAKTMRLGISPSVLKTVSRRFGLPGLALSAGISGYEMFDDYRNKRGMFSEE